VDAITVALIVLAILPWLGSLIESLKYGDLEIKLRQAEANNCPMRRSGSPFLSSHLLSELILKLPPGFGYVRTANWEESGLPRMEKTSMPLPSHKHFQVTAHNAGGESARSAVASVTLS
jgi:hypothetical protein